jgi:hypothetical protein
MHNALIALQDLIDGARRGGQAQTAFPERDPPGQVIENRFGAWRAAESFWRFISNGEDEGFDAWVDAFGWVLACMGLALRDLVQGDIITSRDLPQAGLPLVDPTFRASHGLAQLLLRPVWMEAHEVK